MEHDVFWTLDQLKGNPDESLSNLGSRWKEYISSGKWEIVKSSFWTLPFEYKVMKDIDPSLYRKLSEAKIVFFKGDLNYRYCINKWSTSNILLLDLRSYNNF